MDWHVLAWSRLADAAAGGLIVLAAGSLAARLCRQPVRRARLVMLTLLGTVAVPALATLPVAPRWSAGFPTSPAAFVARADEAAHAAASTDPRPPELAVSRAALVAVERPGDVPTGRARPGPALAPSGPAKPAPAPRWDPIAARMALLGAYLVVAAVMAIWWLVGQVLIWRVTRSARPVPGLVRDAFLDLAGPEGGRVVLLESDRVASPFTYTWRRPVILMPAALCDGSELGTLRYVLAHEWSHVERRDAWAWNLACLAGLVLFYQPLFWWLRRQLRICQDYLADARAADAGSAEDYAAFLVRLARSQMAGPTVPALGIGDRRSNLYRRVIMLVQDQEPLERRCRAAWSLCAATAAAIVIVVASGLRLGAAPPAADDPAKGAQAVKDSARPAADAKKAGETLHYKGTVVDKDTGKPIAGATVVVRRMIFRDSLERRVLQETRHTTGADGEYAFEISPDLSATPALYIELDVEHPDYAPRNGWGYPLSRIRKNEKLNERPFFETMEMRRAQPITGRVETPDGRPAAGVLVLAYSCTDKAGGPTEHCYTQTRTDAQGRFRLPITTPGEGAYWVKPKDYAPELFVVPKGKRGDMGTITLKKGVSVAGRLLDVQGKPIAGVFVVIERPRRLPPDRKALDQIIDSGGVQRAAETDADGRFTFAPLPPGEYTVKPSETNFEGDRKIPWTTRPLTEIFGPTKLTIKEGESPATLEIRAQPTVVIEGRWFDSKGQPGWGFSPLIGGKMDGSSWIAEAHVDPQGRFSVKVPHGLEDATLTIWTSDHAAMRYRMGKDGPLVEGNWPRLGTLDHDVKNLEIVRYVAPIILINATTKDGRQIEGFQADVQYSHPAPNGRKDVGLIGGGNKKEAIHDEQYDGRYRTSSLLPDKEVTVSVSAKGFEGASRKFSLPEGKIEEVTFVLEPKAPRGAGR